jgi:hypothetical protein
MGGVSLSSLSKEALGHARKYKTSCLYYKHVTILNDDSSVISN